MRVWFRIWYQLTVWRLHNHHQLMLPPLRRPTGDQSGKLLTRQQLSIKGSDWTSSRYCSTTATVCGRTHSRHHGPKSKRRYTVRWYVYSASDDTLVHPNHIPRHFIYIYWKKRERKELFVVVLSRILSSRIMSNTITKVSASLIFVTASMPKVSHTSNPSRSPRKTVIICLMEKSFDPQDTTLPLWSDFSSSSFSFVIWRSCSCIVF